MDGARSRAALAAVALMTLLALPWLFYSYYILAIDFGGSNCRDPDLTNCGDSATQF